MYYVVLTMSLYLSLNKISVLFWSVSVVGHCPFIFTSYYDFYEYENNPMKRSPGSATILRSHENCAIIKKYYSKYLD